MDVARVAYNRACRFFRDDQTAGVVKWQEADPRAEELGVSSVIFNKYLEPDDWFEDFGPGEVAGAPRTKTLAFAPVGLTGSHVCGSPADFELGGVRDASLEPVRYGALGWPLCCDPPFRIRGGAGAGGRSPLVVRNVRLAGGAAAGGKSAYAVEPIAAPGTSCETAGVLTPGATVVVSHPGGAVVHWWRLVGFTMATWHAIIEADNPANASLFIGDCPGPAFLEALPTNGACAENGGSVSLDFFITLQPAVLDPFDYELSVDGGDCP